MATLVATELDSGAITTSSLVSGFVFEKSQPTSGFEPLTRCLQNIRSAAPSKTSGARPSWVGGSSKLPRRASTLVGESPARTSSRRGGLSRRPGPFGARRDRLRQTRGNPAPCEQHASTAEPPHGQEVTTHGSTVGWGTGPISGHCAPTTNDRPSDGRSRELWGGSCLDAAEALAVPAARHPDANRSQIAVRYPRRQD